MTETHRRLHLIAKLRPADHPDSMPRDLGEEFGELGEWLSRLKRQQGQQRKQVAAVHTSLAAILGLDDDDPGPQAA